MLRDLAAAAHMAPAKAHRYLVSFARLGLIEQDEGTGRYDLGRYALTLGLAALGRLDPVGIAGQALPALSEATGQTVAVAIWANRGATMVRWQGADTPVSASLRLGSVMPLTRSATGICFAAFGNPRTVSRYLQRELRENIRHGLAPTTAAGVERQVREARRRGFAATNDFIPGISGFAAPVYDSDRTMALALVSLGYTRSFERSAPQIGRAVMRAAADISARLGGPPLAQPSIQQSAQDVTHSARDVRRRRAPSATQAQFP